MLIFVAALIGCEGGSLSTPLLDADSICTPGDCNTGERCVDGRCQPEEVDDPCEVILCPEGQECREGRCWAIDLCAGVTCENDGEVCDPRSGACLAGAADDDGDGVTIADGDCDDSDAQVHPEAPELCDGKDQNCDRVIDDGFPDADDDGFDTCGAGNEGQADCDDAAPGRNPAATESCDGVDEDCDGEVDEEIATRTCRTDCGSGEQRCEGGEWFCSAPESCECTPSGVVDDEPCGRCGERRRTCQDDLSWGAWSGCTGEGVCTPDQNSTCSTICGSVGQQSCDSTCSWRPCVPPTEICNAVDDDCDGEVDRGSCLVLIRRFYNPTTRDHMYKADSTTPDAGYVLEELVFYLYRTQVPDTAEVFQRFNGTDHLVATNPTEGDSAGYTGATSLGYVGPPSAWDVGPLEAEEICRYYDPSTGDHMLFTFRSDEAMAELGLSYIREHCYHFVWGFGAL